MAISNDERREVAAKLRKLEAENHWEKSRFITGFIEALGLETRANVGECLLHLADLIEPEERTCRNISLKAHKGVFCCSECGTHLDIADMEEEDMDVFYEPSCCPTCGLKVVRWDAN